MRAVTWLCHSPVKISTYLNGMPCRQTIPTNPFSSKRFDDGKALGPTPSGFFHSFVARKRWPQAPSISVEAVGIPCLASALGAWYPSRGNTALVDVRSRTLIPRYKSPLSWVHEQPGRKALEIHFMVIAVSAMLHITINRYRNLLIMW